MRTCFILLFMMGTAGTPGLPAISQDEAARDGKIFFKGGPSDIDSHDRNRAVKAIRKWSGPGSRQGKKRLTEAPYFWDYSKVGRPVFIRIIKNDNRDGDLELWLENPETKKYELFKRYRIAYFSGRIGPKTKEGDNQAPEGFYFITPGRMNPHSSYHLSMDMGYPNAYDRKHGRSGSLLMIHGSSVSIGCFAMTDCSIEQIYTLVHEAFKGGQKIVRVHSFPFPMTAVNLEKHRGSSHIEFWMNLKEGWDWFEKNRRPPRVEVSSRKRYVFSSEEMGALPDRSKLRNIQNLRNPSPSPINSEARHAQFR